ncbi:hypothetical protein CYLTODRAFT_493795 [Cylindrobasidium torrendii FP15055 ss-10]|uniref:VPS9 domain-containing protein n=1 Tax=Cylindrobasidium torrendii FP15055 ss-10 TaxID=1314674 RepID=A0A0D7B229_9AGAR|nr:hypothetical protein CYLTODRAFT_493795 [Cylindrobasidium torrendii FP15055 ss-10]
MESKPTIPDLDALRISEPQSSRTDDVQQPAPAVPSISSTFTENAATVLPEPKPVSLSEEQAGVNPWASTSATPVDQLPPSEASIIPREGEQIVAGIGQTTVQDTPDNATRNEVEPHEKEGNVWAESASKDIPPPPPAKSIPPPSTHAEIGLPESAPPPPPTNSDTPPPSFASISAFARSFSLSHKKGHMSVDMAASVPSPNTLSSFATQQQAAPAGLQTEAIREKDETNDSSSSSTSQSTSPRPNEDVPFDFQKFLDQMKTRSAEPVSRYLKSFLTNFAKRTFTVTDQIKIINDFLTFIAKQMVECDIWRDATPAEFDNAMEGMEKLVMNQLYQFTFTPAIAQTSRRAQITADDLERDRVLVQRIRLLEWIEPRHLDIPTEEQAGEGFLAFAQQELLKINSYKAPRDKLICILNCCKVIFGYLRHLKKESEAAGADDFLPILIYSVIKANPDNLLSNVEFISRFRNEKHLGGEAGYYLSSLQGAVAFIETMDHTALSNITQEEFERNVETAIQSLPRDTPEASPSMPSSASDQGPLTPNRASTPNPSSISRPFTPDALSLPAVERLLQKTGSALGRMWNEALDGVETLATPRPVRSSSGYNPNAPRPGTWHGDPEQQWNQQQLQQQYAQQQQYATPAPQRPPLNEPPYQTPYKPRVRRVSPSPSFVEDTPSRPSVADQMYQAQFARHGRQASYPSPSPGSVSPSMRASSPFGGVPPPPNFTARPSGASSRLGIETEYPGQAAREEAAFRESRSAPSSIAQSAPWNATPQGIVPPSPSSLQTTDPAALDTLMQIFPTMDKEIVEMVLDANSGDVGRSIEGLLEMSDGT